MRKMDTPLFKEKQVTHKHDKKQGHRLSLYKILFHFRALL